MRINPRVFAAVCLSFSAAFPTLAAAALPSAVDLGPVGWGLVNQKNQEVAPVFAESADGRQGLASDNSGLRLNSRKPLAAGQALSVVFRFQPPDAAVKKPRCQLTLAVGLADNAVLKRPYFSVLLRYDQGKDQIDWTVQPAATATDEKPKAYRGSYKPGAVALDGSLAWPEHLRRLVEHQVPDSSLAAAWHKLRFELIEKDAVRVWLNGFLLAEHRAAGLDATGLTAIECFNLLVAEAGVGAATAANARHLPVDIGACLNAGEVNGRQPKLEAAGGGVVVNGIPFAVPAPDARGNNHLDIGRSWFPEGMMQGRASGAAGGTGGRWPEPLSSPAWRLQLKVPPGRYQAIHLLAAFDGAADRVPFVTAQFYRPKAGFPESFRSPDVPSFDAAPAAPGAEMQVSFNAGGAGRVHLVTIPLDPGRLLGFADLDALCFELTKGVRLFRSYPDPMFYSEHAAGLPSGVRVFAMTLEKPAVELELTPAVYGDVWTAPELPAYTLKLKNTASVAQQLALNWELRSHDRSDTQRGTLEEALAPGQEKTLTLTLSPKLFGYYDFSVRLRPSGGGDWTEARSLAYLHPDTRERGGWARGRGSLFGFWQWSGGHGTPPAWRQAEVMAKAGAETQNRIIKRDDDRLMEVARRYKMADKRGFADGEIYVANKLREELTKLPEAEALENYMKDMRRRKSEPSDVHQPEYAVFFPEPSLGAFTYGTLPEYSGEPEATDMGPDLESKYQTYLKAFLLGGRAVKKEWPGMKTYMPWGDPTFPVMFLRRSPEFREMFDGVGVDVPGFEHLPEKQIHQISLHRMHFLKNELKKTGKDNIDLVLTEGIHLPSRPGALTEQELADQTIRSLLLFIAYGVDNFACSTSAFECSAAWGEQHYGGGLYNRVPIETPKPAYAAFATLTRNLNRCNFSRWLPTGSLSTYCLEFTHSGSGAKVYVLWTLRGRREVALAVAEPGKAVGRDQMDNPLPLRQTGAGVAFTISPAPVFIHTAAATAESCAAGAPDHADAQPAEHRLRLGNLGDGNWKTSADRDRDYEDAFSDWIRRFPAAMETGTAEAPAAAGGKALAVTLPKPATDRIYMPFYTTLNPAAPIVIPGKPAGLGIWVRAASDWGRVVYCVRDAKGEKWLNIGQRGAWNCDDILALSAFNFDGWRYLSFPLPGSAPYDTYRENGTTWWGAYSQGDGIVDLPLTLEKIIVERRTHAMYVNSPQPAATEPVLLGDLFAEYAGPADQGDEAVRISRLRMPLPAGLPALKNPLDAFAGGSLEPPVISGIRIDDQVADGTRCMVDFSPVAGAAAYDVWVSCYPDGSGALRLGKDWPAPGRTLRGLTPDTDFYLFVTATAADKQTSRPSAAFKIRLQDRFGMK